MTNAKHIITLSGSFELTVSQLGLPCPTPEQEKALLEAVSLLNLVGIKLKAEPGVRLEKPEPKPRMPRRTREEITRVERVAVQFPDDIYIEANLNFPSYDAGQAPQRTKAEALAELAAEKYDACETAQAVADMMEESRHG